MTPGATSPRTIRKRWRRPRPRPTISRPSCTRAAISASWPRSFSDGPTAAEGGDLGSYKRGAAGQGARGPDFPLKTGEYTEPIRTKQGYVIFKVVEHTPGGVPAFKDVEQEVEQAYYMSKMEPAIRDYLTQMRDDAYIEIKPGYVDTGASPNKRVFPIAYSAYTPPAPKKKKKVERTRFRETTHGFRQKSPQAALPAEQAAAPPPTATKSKKAKTEQSRNKLQEAGQEREDPLRQGAAGDAAHGGLQARLRMRERCQKRPRALRPAPDNPLETAAPARKEDAFQRPCQRAQAEEDQRSAAEGCDRSRGP